MQRGKGDQPLQLGQEGRPHPLGRGMIRSPVDHTVAHRDRGRKTHLRGSREHRLDRRRMVGEITAFIHQIFIVRTLDPEVSVCQADALHRSLGKPSLVRPPELVEGEL